MRLLNKVCKNLSIGVRVNYPASSTKTLLYNCCRYNASAMTSQTTCCAGGRLRPDARGASDLHGTFNPTRRKMFMQPA